MQMNSENVVTRGNFKSNVSGEGEKSETGVGGESNVKFNPER